MKNRIAAMILVALAAGTLTARSPKAGVSPEKQKTTQKETQTETESETETELLPLTGETETELLPLTAETESELLTLAAETESELLPVTAVKESEIAPQAAETESELLPVTAGTESETAPQAVETESELLPVTMEKESEIAPQAAETESELLPVTMENESEIAPQAVETESELLPVTMENESEIAPQTEAETEAERELPDKAEYTIYNKTGSEITRLTITDNRLGRVVFSIVDPLENGDAVKAEFRKTAAITHDTSYTLSYETSDGYKAEYENLEFMVAEIRLTGRITRQGNESLDVIPEGAGTAADKAEYTFRNATGGEITELMLVNDITGEIAEDITDGLADGETCTIVLDPNEDSDSETESDTESGAEDSTESGAEDSTESGADVSTGIDIERGIAPGDPDSTQRDMTYTVIFRTDSGYEGRYRVPGHGTAELELIGGNATS